MNFYVESSVSPSDPEECGCEMNQVPWPLPQSIRRDLNIVLCHKMAMEKLEMTPHQGQREACPGH